MCTSPLHIKNPLKKFNPLVDKRYIDVPCGHCWQCRQNKRNDAFIRAYFEHLKCEKLGGYSVFFTLTYAPAYLPTVSYHNIPCFDGSHLKNYMKRLRMRLHRLCKKYHFGSVVNSKFIPLIDGKLTYQINSEYGSKTHRPHYHCLFHIACNFPRYLFLQEAKKAWNDMGFTYSSHHANGIINGIGALKYVAKYITKDFITDDYLKQVKDWVTTDVTLSQEEKDYIYDKILPIHRHSRYYGVFGISQFLTDEQRERIKLYEVNDILPQTEESILKASILIPDKEKGVKTYKLPLYFQRFLFYRTEIETHIVPDDAPTEIKEKHPKGVITSPSYVLNDYGRKSRLMRLDEFLKASADTFKFVLGSRPYDEEGFVKFFNKSGVGNIETYEQYKNRLLLLSDNLSNEFLDWSFYYRGYINMLDDCPCEKQTFFTCREQYQERLKYDRFINNIYDFNLEGIQYKDVFEDIQTSINNILCKNKSYESAHQLFDILLMYYNSLKDIHSYEIEYNAYHNKLLTNPT